MFVILFSLVIAERLFVEVTEQVKRFDRNVSAFDGPLQETPEVLHAVRVNVAVNVALGVIDNLVSVFRQSLVRLQGVRAERGAGCNVIAHAALDIALAARADMLRVDLASLAVQQAEHDFLAHRATTLNHLFAASSVHVAGFAADKGFVRFDRTGHLVDGSVMHRIANPVKHEPGGFLSYLQIAGDFVRRNAVFAISDEPHRAQPLIERNWAVLEDRSDFDGELLAALQAGPSAPRFDIREALCRAARAFRSSGPLGRRYRLIADFRIGEIFNRFNESRGKFSCHEPILTLEFV